MNIDERIAREAKYILKNKSTVRATAKVFGISKSTVHNDLKNKLAGINRALFEKVNKLLHFNASVRHLRGGQSTKNKYMQIKSKLRT